MASARRDLSADRSVRRRRNSMECMIQYEKGKCKQGNADDIYERHNHLIKQASQFNVIMMGLNRDNV